MTEIHAETLYEGESRTIAVDVTDQDGNAVDLTDGSAEYLVVDDSDQQLLQKTESGGGIQFTAPAEGSLSVRLAPADTQGEAGKYKHFLKVTDTDGNVSVVLTGRFIVRETPF